VKVAIVGCGTAGPAAALLLARDGHEVEIFERVAEPRGVGAGILLQRLGQRVLADLGLAAELERQSSPVRRVDARTLSGRRVLDFAYDEVVPGAYGWGVNRGTLFGLLWSAVQDAGIPVQTGVEVTGLVTVKGRWRLTTTAGEVGPFDLVVGADGGRSRIRKLSGLTKKDVGYPYGVIWSVVPDPERIAGDTLTQRYRDTRVTLGILPTGVAQACIFWLIRSRLISETLSAGPSAWVDLARPIAGEFEPLVERAADGAIMGARYRDVVVRSPVLATDSAGLVLLGDAAHAMSPQLGLGASFALADAWALATCLRRRPRDLSEALQAYASARAAHVRYYTWCSRLMTPVFQSDLVPIGWARDALMEPIARIPWVRGQFVTTFMGGRTSPWTFWRPPH
jgi:2-polyprenyl-6-methoxyphenol hydroxylase-like FAD-dependent oxidoreductase